MSDKNDGLKAEAQGYGIGNYIKQYTHPSGLRRALTESVSSKFEERMDTLREADKGMRETAANLKDYLSSAKQAFKDNRYLDVAHWCAQIDGAVRGMVQEGKPVVDLRDAEIAEFYTKYEDAEPDHDYFASADDGLISTAGVLDRLFGNSIEKLYWKKVKESKLAVQSLIKSAEKLVSIVLSCLGRMGDARAKGNIAVWIEDLQRMGKAQSEFQVFARGIYDKHLKQLADIVKANKPKPNATPAPVNQTNKTAPAMPSANKAEEAAELVEEVPTKPAEVVAPEVVAPKLEPGRPTRDQAAKKKEMEQIDQLQKALNNPAPSASEIPVVESPKAEEAVTPEIAKIEAPKIEAPKQEVAKMEMPKPEAVKSVSAPAPAPAPKVVEQPKIVAPVKLEPQEEIPVQMSAPIPEIPSAPLPEIKVPSTPPAASNPSGAVAARPRGRPRLYPIGESPTDIKKREKEQKKNLVNSPSAPANSDVATTEPNVKSVAPMINKEVSVPAPTVNAPSDSKEIDLNKKVIDTPPKDDKKIIFVLLPKIKPDNLDTMQYRLMKDMGHPVKFVTQENGKQIAKDYIDAGWDIEPMTYEEVKAIDEKHKNNPLEMLDDPEFLQSLPRLSNGMFDKGRLIDDNGQTIQGNKVVSMPSKYPDFQNLDEKTRKAVIDKLNKLEENPSNLIVPVKKEKVKKPENSIETPISDEPSKVNEKITDPEEADLIKQLEEIPNPEEDDDAAIFMHTGYLEKMLKKSMDQISSNDVLHLLTTKAYIDLLPRNKDGSFNIELIKKFPEYQIMAQKGMKSKYLSVLDNKRKVELREKAANHEFFFNELQKVANVEDYGLMAAMMCAYSEEIESFDSETSIKLIKAAEKLI